MAEGWSWHWTAARIGPPWVLARGHLDPNTWTDLRAVHPSARMRLQRAGTQRGRHLLGWQPWVQTRAPTRHQVAAIGSHGSAGLRALRIAMHATFRAVRSHRHARAPWASLSSLLPRSLRPCLPFSLLVFSSMLRDALFRERTVLLPTYHFRLRSFQLALPRTFVCGHVWLVLSWRGTSSVGRSHGCRCAWFFGFRPGTDTACVVLRLVPGTLVRSSFRCAACAYVPLVSTSSRACPLLPPRDPSRTPLNPLSLNPLSLNPLSLNPSQSSLSQSLSISGGVGEAGPSGGGRTFLMAGGVGMKRLDNCEVTSLTKLLWSRVRRDFMMRTMAASI